MAIHKGAISAITTEVAVRPGLGLGLARAASLGAFYKITAPQKRQLHR